jgi:hypothetical protein
MSSRLIKLASAVVLAAPLVLVFGPHSANAYDCDQKYGGDTSHPTCNDVGLPLRVQDGKPYRVTATTGGPFGDDTALALCDGASVDTSSGLDFRGAETADTAGSVTQSKGLLVAGLGDHVGRIVAYEVQFADDTVRTITVTCRDDHAPFTH